MSPDKKHYSCIIIYIFILLIVVFLSLHLAAAYDWAVQNPVVETVYGNTTRERFNYSGFAKTLESSMSETPFEFSWNEYSGKLLAFTCGMTLFIFLYLYTSRGKYMKGKEHGSAVWGDKKELKSLGFKAVKKLLVKQAKEGLKENEKALKKDKSLSSKERYALIEDKREKTEKRIESIKKNTNKNSMIVLAWKVMFSIYNQEINSNVMIYGGSGAGKTRSIVMPNILNLAGTCSFVVTDPKGEIYQKSKYFLKKMGYKVRCLNLFEKKKTSHYNPFEYIHLEREEDGYDWQEDVLTLLDTMIINLSGGEGRKSPDPFWEDAPRHFIQSLFFFVVYMLDKEDQNMNSVMELLGMLEIEEDEDNYDCPLDIAFQTLGEKFGKDNIAYRTYKDFRTKAKGKTAASIAMTMVSKLQPYNIASMQAMSDRDELELDKIGEELTALFVIVPPVSKTFNFVAGEMFTQLFQELNYCAGALHGGRLPVPVQFIMDEFANTCIIPNFPNIISYARSLGIGIMPIIQSRAQLKGMYEKEWEIITDNCSSTVFLGSIISEDTLKWMSTCMLGTGTYDDVDYSETHGNQASTSRQKKKYGRELMKPDEIKTMPKNDCLVIINGKNPLYCKKYKYKKHENYKYTSDFDGRLPKVFEEWEDREVRQSHHGEEIDREVRQTVEDVLNRADNIKIDNDPDSVMEYMESHYIGAWNFASDDTLIVDEGESEDVLWELEVEEELAKDKEEVTGIVNSMADLYKQIEAQKIETSAEPEVILKTLEQWSNNMESISFVSDDTLIVDEGESEDELWEDDNEELKGLDDIISNAKNLETELSEVASLQQENGLSMNELFGADDEPDDEEDEE